MLFIAPETDISVNLLFQRASNSHSRLYLVAFSLEDRHHFKA